MPWASCALKEAVLRRFRALESASCQVKHPACRCRSVANRSRANVLTGTLTTVGSSRGAPANQAALRVLPCQRCNAAPNPGGVRQTFESATRASAFFNDRVPLRPDRPSVRTSCTLPLRFRLGHARPPPAWSSATRGIFLPLDERAILAAQSRVLELAHLVERLAEVSDDVKLVEQNRCLRGVLSSRVAKRLPHVDGDLNPRDSGERRGLTTGAPVVD